MRSLAIASVLGVVTGLAAAEPPQTAQWDFEDAPIGRLPEGWSAAKTGQGPGSVWRVIQDETAPAGPKVLAQTSSQGPRPLFNLCVADGTSHRDMDLSVSLKAMAGKIDQGGGPVWRFQDADNYYIARVNPLENNFRVYKVVRGQRTQLATSDVEAPAGKWHTIRIMQDGERIRCWLNGKLHLDVKDDTITKAGKVGLWTKADAVTSFDELKVAGSAE